MLLKFKVENFRSIKSAVLDFTRKSDERVGTEMMTSLIEKQNYVDGVVPVMAVFGANASGKSNFMKALLCMQRYILTDGLSMREPFKLDEKSQDLPTEFTIELLLDGRICEYVLRIDDVHVMKESLHVIDGDKRDCIFDIGVDNENNRVELPEPEKFVQFEQYDFRRCFLGYVYHKIKGNEKYDGFKAMVNERGLEERYEIILHVYEFFQKKLCLIDNVRSTSSPIQFLESAQGKNGWKLKAGEVLKEMGLDLVLATYLPGQGDTIEDNINYYHSGAVGGYYKLKSFREESLGTRNLLLFVQMVLDVLSVGGCLCVDEIDRTLHTDIIVFILHLFKSRRFNKYGAQLICTSHNPCIMLWLNKYEITVVSKFNQVSRFERISDEKFGINEGKDILQEYIKGHLGGVPRMRTVMFYDDVSEETAGD